MSRRSSTGGAAFRGIMPLKLMLFDLWGTLFLSDGPNEGPPREELRRRMVHEALEPLGARFDDAHVQRAFAAAAAELSAIHAEHRDIAAEDRTVLYMRHLDDMLPDRIDDAGWERLHRAVLAPALVLPPVPMPGAAEALRSVKALGVPTCLVSNAGITPGFVLREVLDRYGLLEYLDHTIFSDEVELAKPAAAIFEQALDIFDVPPDQSAFLGDQPVLDVLGPQAVGIWTVQIGDVAEDGIAPHARIEALSGLVPALGSLGLL